MRKRNTDRTSSGAEEHLVKVVPPPDLGDELAELLRVLENTEEELRHAVQLVLTHGRSDAAMSFAGRALVLATEIHQASMALAVAASDIAEGPKSGARPVEAPPVPHAEKPKRTYKPRKPKAAAADVDSRQTEAFVDARDRALLAKIDTEAFASVRCPDHGTAELVDGECTAPGCVVPMVRAVAE